MQGSFSERSHTTIVVAHGLLHKDLSSKPLGVVRSKKCVSGLQDACLVVVVPELPEMSINAMIFAACCFHPKCGVPDVEDEMVRPGMTSRHTCIHLPTYVRHRVPRCFDFACDVDKPEVALKVQIYCMVSDGGMVREPGKTSGTTMHHIKPPPPLQL